MKKTVNLVVLFCGIFIFGGVLILVGAVILGGGAGCANKEPVAPSALNENIKADFKPAVDQPCVGSYPVTACNTVYEIPCGCQYSSNCPITAIGCTTPVVTDTPIPTPISSPTPIFTPTISPTPLGTVTTTPSITLTPPTDTPTVPFTNTPTVPPTTTPMPTNTPEPTPPPVPTETPVPTPNLVACAQCDQDFADRNNKARNDFQDELLQGSQTCLAIFGGVPPQYGGPELLEACNAADEGIAFAILSAKLIASVVEHNICLTDNNCP